jgi:hypothetical protein
MSADHRPVGGSRDHRPQHLLRDSAGVSRAGFCVALLLLFAGCPPDSDTTQQTPTSSEARNTEPGAPASPAIQLRQQLAIQTAQRWLDALELDSATLIAHGIKGKKKLAEILSAYLYLLRYGSDPSARPDLSRRFRELAEQASRPEYHNMLRCDGREFNENKMSYLRVAWLLEHFGEQTELYRTQLDEIRPRLDRALANQPAWQRVPFAKYYDHFGWTPPATLLEPVEGLIARRLPLARYRRAAGYSLTHEVSDAFRTGLRRTQDVFDPDDRRYLQEILPQLTVRFIGADNPDLVGELLSSMTYLELHEHPTYWQGIEYLLARQNADGTWGDYERYRPTLGGYVDQKLYLHTTLVTLRALLEANDGAWLRSTSAPRT